jgi:hypothetical protein
MYLVSDPGGSAIVFNEKDCCVNGRRNSTSRLGDPHDILDHPSCEMPRAPA